MEIKKIISKYLDSNTFVVKKDGKCLIIDAGADIAAIDSEVNENKVVAILLTHGHYDHVINSERLAEEYNCKIYINENAEKTLLNPKLNYGETFRVENMNDFVFTRDDCELLLENFNVKVFHTPGHSDCCNSYLIEENLFSGDFLFSGGIGRVDLLTSDVNDMIKSLDKIDSVDFKNCYCGHYDDTDKTRVNQVVKVYKKFLEREKK